MSLTLSAQAREQIRKALIEVTHDIQREMSIAGLDQVVLTVRIDQKGAAAKYTATATATQEELITFTSAKLAPQSPEFPPRPGGK